ncbi:hypothetical protein GCM10027578_42000 [Spirosoma luteolum]
MKHVSLAAGLVVWLLLPLVSMAQIQISFPTDRAIFQRNQANQATFRITGYYTTGVSRIEARLTARNNQGTTTNWQVVQNNPTGGVYAGDITGQGGWYSLEVRGMNGDQQVGNSTTIDRIGIGEVFIVAGQSNAQGVHQDAPVSTDDRVNCVNYRYPNDGFPNDPPVAQFSHIDNSPDFTIAPRGMGTWCWGRLGDLLASRLNVPILFFNGAFTGTAIQNWRQSAPPGGVAVSVYDPTLTYAARQPYINLKLSLQFYAHTLGVRAILWQQGEADNLINTSSASYTSDLTYLINQSRQDFGRNMSWVVARASYGDRVPNRVNPGIIAAQTNIVNTVPNVFAGPSTDNIQIPRTRPPLNDPEGFHFDYNGLVEVASAWNTSLNDSFFQQSSPLPPVASPTVGIACSGNNLTISVNGEYSSFQWESGETSRSITKGPGLYRAKVKDALGNTAFTSYVRVSDTPVATVADNRQAAICAGSSLALTTNYDAVQWVNQQTNTVIATSRQVNISTAGTYQVRYNDVSGCQFVSNAISLSVNPLPATPTITADRSTTFCQGDNTVLRTSAQSVRYNWSDGQQGQAVTVGKSGTYTLSVTDQNGCTSATSNSIPVTVNPLPAKPTIATNGPTTFCADRTITLTAPDAVSYIWTSGQSTKTLTIAQSGNFGVQVTNTFGCVSERSDIVNITVNPLPATPSVSAAGATTFCAGNTVNLSAATPLNVVWSSGQTDKTITVSQSGNYAAQAKDGNGCLSPYSTVLAVQVNPLPAAPTLLTDKSPILCEGDRVTFTVNGPYTVYWSTGDTARSIVTSRAGLYSARVRDVNGCLSTQSGATRVELRALPPAPTVNAIGTFTLEAVSSTNSPVFLWRRGADTLAARTAIVKAGTSGAYTAQSSTVYSNTLTCFSLPSTAFTLTIDESLAGLSVYPNPSPDRVITIETQQDLTNATVAVYSLTGQLLYTTTVPSFNERRRLELAGLAGGTYILNVQAADYNVSRRILVGL